MGGASSDASVMKAASGEDLVPKQGMKKLFGKPNQKKDGTTGKVTAKGPASQPPAASSGRR